jgi:hypothetical protein
MDEVLYLLGSISASLLLLGHVGWLAAKLGRRMRSRRQDDQLTDQFARLRQEVSTQLGTMSGDVRSALEDVHERLDFAERILAKERGVPSEHEQHETH